MYVLNSGFQQLEGIASQISGLQHKQTIKQKGNIAINFCRLLAGHTGEDIIKIISIVKETVLHGERTTK